MPCYVFGVYAEGVALLNVVIQHSRKQIIGSADGVKVAREVEVDVLHRNNLGIAAAGSAALYTENRSERRLSQRNAYILADAL